MKIDHVGIVVKSMDKGIEHWEKVFGYKQMTRVVTNTRQKVKVVFMKKEGSLTVKLIEPSDESSPVFVFAQKGGGLHHLCFTCSDVQSETEKLSAMGLRVISQPQPGEAFGNSSIAFVYAGQGLNIELIDTANKAEIL